MCLGENAKMGAILGGVTKRQFVKGDYLEEDRHGGGGRGGRGRERGGGETLRMWCPHRDEGWDKG